MTYRQYIYLSLLLFLSATTCVLPAQDSAAYYYNLSDSPGKIKDPCERLRYADRAIALHSSDHYYSGRAEMKMFFLGDIPGAIADYKMAIKACKKDSVSSKSIYYGEAASWLQYAGEYKEAIYCLKRAYKYRVKAGYVYDATLDSLVHKTKLSKEEKRFLLTGRQWQDKNPYALQDSIKLYIENIRWFEKTGSYNRQTLVVFAQQYYALSRFKEAFQVMDKAISLFPDSYAAYYYRAQMNLGRGDMEAANRDFKKAEELGFPYPVRYDYKRCAP